MKKSLIGFTSIICIIFLLLNYCVYAVEDVNKTITENENDILLSEENIEQTESLEDERNDNDNQNENVEEVNEIQSEDTKIVKETEKTIIKQPNEKSAESIQKVGAQAENKKDELLPQSSSIEEGVYIIRSSLNSNLVLDVSEASKNNMANIQIWKDGTVRQQRFRIKKIDSKYYSIMAEHSGKYLDVQYAGKVNGTNVEQYSLNNTDAQKWIIMDEGNGEYSIISKCNGLYLDVEGGKEKYGTNIQLYEGNGTKAQKFKLDRMDLPNQAPADIKDGRYIIETGVKQNKVLDVSEGSTNDNANVQIWENASVIQQRFEIKFEQGYYSIKSEKSGKSLDAQNYGISNGTNVQQYTYSGNVAQQWILKPLGDGYYNIISKYSGLYLDIFEARNNNGANVQLYKGNGTKAQKFKLKKIGIDDQEKIDLEEGKYIIRSSIDNNKAFDVSRASKENGANIQIWKSCHDTQQQFEIKYEKGFYSIINVNSGKSLDIQNSGVSNGSNVQQNSYSGRETQKWIIINNEDGSYSLQSKYNGLYVDLAYGLTENGTNVQLYERNGTKAQKFILEKVENYIGEKTLDDGTYQIKSTINNKYVLDVADRSTSNNANIQIWEKANGINQYFNIRYIGDGYYNIIAVNSGKSLDVESYGKCNGTNVQQYEYSNNDAQKWIIKEENGAYYIISKTNNLFLTVADSKASNGRNIYTWEKKNDNSQKFIIEKSTPKSEKTIKEGVYEIATNKSNKLMMDVLGASTDENANIQLWDRNGTIAQKFKVEYVDDTYRIVAQNSNKILTVDENNNVVQRSSNNSNQQKWIIKSDGRGNYNIVSVYNGKYLELEGKLSSGANVQVGTENVSKSQSFQFFKKIYTVVLNPGHGGKDSGCVGYISTLLEKNITLKIAQYLREELNKYSNYNIILTHEGLGDNDEMSLADRAQIARDNNADVYVSLHINAEPKNTASGSMVFVPYYEGQKHYNSSMSKLGSFVQNWLENIGIRKYSTEAITKRCNDHDSRYQYLENGNIVQADYYADIRHAMKGNTLGYGPDLNTETGIPAILIEHCFINTDTRFVDNDSSIRKIAEADANAIREFFETN